MRLVAQFQAQQGFRQLVVDALGRIARARGDVAEAAAQLERALETFRATQAQYDLGRAHLELAALAHASGQRDVATAHLTEARRLFDSLRVPRYVARSEQLAQEFGVALPEEALHPSR